MNLLRRYWVRITIIFVVILILGATWAVTNSSRYWSRRSIIVTRDGTVAPDAVAFKSKEGWYLIYISSEDFWYAFYPQNGHMGLCAMDGKYLSFYVGLLLRDETTPCVSFNPIKAQDPHLVIRQDGLQFTSMRNERIDVSWYGP